MDIGSWLRDLGLERYAQTFREHEVDLEVLSDLSEADLEKLGIPLGHRKKLLKAIARLADAGTTADEPPRTEAERRQLTVMFVDLVGSTELSTRLDPEDMSAVIRAFQDCCAGVVGRWGGHLAKFMGDGALVYFGWPQAHEDDAERAVRAGLELAAAVSGLTTPKAARLAARVGIATGPVLVGEIAGEGAGHEDQVVGETPNLAARLQALAAPGTVVIAERTRRLLGGLFALSDLGPVRLKGFAEPLAAFRVEGEGRSEGRFEALRGGGRLTPLVGREHELGILLERWARARDGDGQVVLLVGEPGIGKSRLIRTLREELSGQPHFALSHFCSPYHQNSALYPVASQLERAAGIVADDRPDVKFTKLEALLGRATNRPDEAAPLFAVLLGIPTGDRYPAVSPTPQRQKQRMLEVLIDQLAGLARQRPVLELYEDLHWGDPSTLELLDLLVERASNLPVLIVLTYRPEFSPRWSGRAHVTTLPLNRLGRREGTLLIERVAGAKALPGDVLDQILARTEGIPLFVEELTKTVLESGVLTDAGDRYELSGPLPPLAIPTTLQDSLMARLDRLSPVKEIAQIGAVIGREFSHRLLASVSGRPEEQLGAALERLVASELVFRRGAPPDATYSFKHALVQDAAYQSLLKSRRLQLHARIAQALSEAIGVSPELMAHHLTEAGLIEQAVPWWHRAGNEASQRSASVEASAHCMKGLTLLRTLAESEGRARQELTLELALGSALIQTKGDAAVEVETSYSRARELCLQLDEPRQLFTASFGLWLLHVSRMELGAARGLVDELLVVAERERDPGLVLQAHHVAWSTCFYAPEQPACFEHTEYSLALYDRDRHASHKHLYGGHDPCVCGYNYRAMSLALLGYPERALDSAMRAVTLARELQHQFSLVLAFSWSAFVRQFYGDTRGACQFSENAMALCAEHGIAPQYLATARAVGGWAIAVESDPRKGADEIRKGLEALEATGVSLRRSYCLGLLAEAVRRMGDVAMGQAALTEALAFMDQTGERWWEAEVHRLRGELLIEGGSSVEEAVACIERAVAVARAQTFKALELRAATSLARLWRAQDKREEARGLLAPIYGWFTEGFDTADLKEVKALLDELQ